MRLLLPVLSLLTFPGADLLAQGLTDSQSRRIDSVFAAFDRTDRPGCALGVSRNGQVVYQRGYGMSNLEYGLAITPGSIFHVASISKQFTAFAVALLARQGKLSLDDEVRKHLPELPDYGQRITLRHLMHHTSGIRDQWELLSLAGWREDDPITEEDILDIVTRQKTLNFAPGAENLYSNSGYTLLAVIVKRASGLRLREFAEQQIFGPLGMQDTHFHNDHTMIVPNRTSAYQERRGGGGGWQISIPVFDNDGATSLHTTVGDLLKWEQNFSDGRGGGAALLGEAQTSGRLNDGKSIDYGFGLSLETYRGAKAVGHGGADAGYRADVVRFPEQGLALAVLCNFAGATPGQYSRQVADIILEGKLGPASPSTTASTGAPVSLSPAQLAAVAGVYRKPGTDEVWLFAVRNGALALMNFGGAPLTPLAERRFTAFGVVVEFGNAEPVEALARFGEQVIGTYRKVPAFTPTKAQLAAFAGEYRSEELGVTYHIAARDTGLVLQRRKFEDAASIPAFEDAFSGSVGTAHFTRLRGRVTGFLLTGGRVRNLRFDRVEPTVSGKAVSGKR